MRVGGRAYGTTRFRAGAAHQPNVIRDGSGGAAYLVRFGIQLIRRSTLPLPEKTDLLTPLAFLRAYRDGLVTNLSNPKVVELFVSPVGAQTLEQSREGRSEQL